MTDRQRAMTDRQEGPTLRNREELRVTRITAILPFGALLQNTIQVFGQEQIRMG